MATVEETKELILRYWQSWQDMDFDTLRDCLADEVDTGGKVLPPEWFIEICGGHALKEVDLIASVFGEGEGSLLYQGQDALTRQVYRVAEFIKVESGKIVATHACFEVGTTDSPPL